jgi:hypothetical protein
MSIDPQLHQWLLDQACWDQPDTAPNIDIDDLEKTFGITLPADYRSIIANCYCGTFDTEKDSIWICSYDHLYDANTDPFWMIPLDGMFIFALDHGGNLYAYDPWNRLGKGEYAVYYISRGDLDLSQARYLGCSLTEVMESGLKDTEGFHNRPTMENDLSGKIVEKQVPKAVISSVDDLYLHLPRTIRHPRYGAATLDPKADGELVSGGYQLADTDIIYYTFRTTPQDFYDSIIAYLVMDGVA